MSFLTPLYILGVLAVAGPIVFHLIRRSPRGEVPFSSLMFLAPTPPRLTRRSRLDHLLLLLLRAAALALLAFAFARPFLRQAARLENPDGERRRIAVLIDTSASLRRGDLWARARARAAEAIAGCRPADELGVFAFDAAMRPVFGFDESATLDPTRRLAVARARLDALEPSWGATHLGQALIDVVAAVEDVADASEKAGRMLRKVILVSDLQQGSRLEALGDFEWPSDVELDLRTVTDRGGNAGLHPLSDLADVEATTAADASVRGGPTPRHRVRVSNDPGSRRESFELSWVDEKGAATSKPVGVYVPPGESRVVRVPPPADPSPRRTLRLSGDSSGFDNTAYFVDERRDETNVLYVGKDAADDPAGLLYYLERVFPDTPRRRVRVAALTPAAALDRVLEPAAPERPPALVIVASETPAAGAERLRAYLSGGGTVLAVLTAPGPASTLAVLAGTTPRDLEEAAVARDVMLGEIAFDHPLFASLAAAQFNDFTKIHFWKYRRLDPRALGDARVLARFENGDAAVIEKPVGRGKLVVLASGWHPADSQLARSSKFVPLMTALLDGPTARPLEEASRLVGDRVALPVSGPAGRELVVHRPDGGVVRMAAGSSFDQTDQPGVYLVDTAEGARSFAVNLDPLESKTAPLHLETLEQFGCRLANPGRRAIDRDHRRQMQNVELESRQKLWRWLILAAMGVLIVETWLAGRRQRPRPAHAEVLAT